MSGPTTPAPLPPGDDGPLVVVQTFILEKFDGEKVPGDGKVPVEIIEGGDGLPTLRTRKDGVDLPEPEVLKQADLSEIIKQGE